MGREPPYQLKQRQLKSGTAAIAAEMTAIGAKEREPENPTADAEDKSETTAEGRDTKSNP